MKCPTCKKEFLPYNGIEEMCPTKGCDSGVTNSVIKIDLVRLVSYEPTNYTTCTLNVNGEEYYYKLVRSTKDI